MSSGEMIALKVVMSDPGKGDPFGVVGCQYNFQKHKIQLKLAKQFINKPWSVPAKYLIKVKN